MGCLTCLTFQQTYLLIMGKFFLQMLFDQQECNKKFNPTLKDTLCQYPECNNSTIIDIQMDIVKPPPIIKSPIKINSHIQPRLLPLSTAPAPPPQNMFYTLPQLFELPLLGQQPIFPATLVIYKLAFYLYGCKKNYDYWIRKRVMKVRGEASYDSNYPFK